MSAVMLSTSPELKASLHAHLFDARHGYFAFMLAEVHSGATHELRLVDLYAVPPDELDLTSGLHVALTDAGRAKMIKWAWGKGLALVEAHVHVGDRATRFSRTDLSGLAEFVPHLWWRLGGRPYAAMVWSRGGFDALAWMNDPMRADQVIGFAVDGHELARPSGLSLELFNSTAASDG